MTTRSRPSSAAYAAGWDRIFGKPRKPTKLGRIWKQAKKDFAKPQRVSRETGGAIGAGDLNEDLMVTWNTYKFQNSSVVPFDKAIPKSNQGL